MAGDPPCIIHVLYVYINSPYFTK